MKFSIKDFSSKRDQIRRKLRIWSHLLEKSLMENFIFCAVKSVFAQSGWILPRLDVWIWLNVFASRHLSVQS